MKTTCPACGAVASLDVLIGHEGARDAVMAALGLPAPLGKLLVQYIALFRPAQRQLSMDRLASLLNELQPMIAEAKIERGGRIWSAPQDYWQMALTEMIAKRDKLTLPLKSHGYLLEVIVGYSSKAEAKAETQQENHKAGRTPVGKHASHKTFEDSPHTPKTERQPMPEFVKSALRKGGENDGNN